MCGTKKFWFFCLFSHAILAASILHRHLAHYQCMLKNKYLIFHSSLVVMALAYLFLSHIFILDRINLLENLDKNHRLFAELISTNIYVTDQIIHIHWCYRCYYFFFFSNGDSCYNFQNAINFLMAHYHCYYHYCERYCHSICRWGYNLNMVNCIIVIKTNSFNISWNSILFTDLTCLHFAY